MKPHLLSLLLLCTGCATTPTPCVCEPMSQRLLRYRDYHTCRTGPWAQQWVRDLGWQGKNEFASDFDALVLPIACEVFDVDGDGDVDLYDYQRM